jgi:hypothetical protein
LIQEIISKNSNIRNFTTGVRLVKDIRKPESNYWQMNNDNTRSDCLKKLPTRNKDKKRLKSSHKVLATVVNP